MKIILICIFQKSKSVECFDDFTQCELTRQTNGISDFKLNAIRTKNIVAITGYFVCVSIAIQTALFSLEFSIKNGQYSIITGYATKSSYSIYTSSTSVITNIAIPADSYYCNSCFIVKEL